MCHASRALTRETDVYHMTGAGSQHLKRILERHGDDAPAILRIAHAPSIAAVAGTWAPPPALAPLMARILRLLREVRAKHVFVWLAEFDVRRRYPWGERALALASYGANHGAWGSLPPAYATAAPRAPADRHRGRTTLTAPSASKPSMTCGPLPEPALARRLADGHAAHMRFAAFVMPQSDRRSTSQHDCSTRCPLCRATRHVFMQP